MSQIMKAFTGIFMVLFMVAASMGALSGFIQVSKAMEFHASVIDELENSDYCSSVLEACFEAAQRGGYELKVTLFEVQGGSVIYEDISDVLEPDKHIQMAKVDMRFYINIPFFALRNEQNISGYGR